ncbi:hypothetical protein ACMXYN_09640 [Neptuniibacter sp. PT8_73]|uniref:hypothetical protein n=1 Tax=Neptuniibacter sp. PT8_73 TaxID=3398206 RepID=UPI0039F485CC
MATTLLTLSRQHSAGKISTADYRAQRRNLVNEQVFQVEDCTQPGFVNEPELTEVADSTLPPAQTADEQSANQAAPFYHPNSSAVIPEPSQTPAYTISDRSENPVESSTLNTRKRLEELSKPKSEPAYNHQPAEAQHVSYKKILLALLIGLVVTSIITGTMLLTRDERPAIVVEDPLITSTNLLLDNPDWQVVDLRVYRVQIKAQNRPMLPEQHALLDSVNLYLSVPLGGTASELDVEVQLLKEDLLVLRNVK